MKLEIKEIDGVPVTGIPDGSRTAVKNLSPKVFMSRQETRNLK